jgi:catechol 2,3-dioxygenase-like lactoylglutathione lyase family enzyme
MLTDRSLVGFVPTTDLARARSFYEGTLGLRVRHEDGFALVVDAAGTTVRVTLVESFDPQPFTVLGWEVDDIGADVRDLVARGVVFERFGFLEQDDDGVWTAPSGDRVAWFKDPDGNLLSLGGPAAGPA